jgi:hypothetical protein
VLLERRVGIVPLMGHFEEGLVEGSTFWSGNVVVLMREPAVPFGWHHVSVGAAHRQIVIILHPSSLRLVCIEPEIQRGLKSS